MTDPITSRILQFLSESDHLLVPIEELYNSLRDEGMLSVTSEENFEQLIVSDDRFEIYESLGHSDLFHPSVQAELRSRGLLTGPLVMLRERGSDTEQIMHDVLLHLKEMNQALETAWQLRPEGNDEIENELLNLLMMGDILEREIMHAIQSGTIVMEIDVDGVEETPDLKGK
ncbi:MAG: hypothetical protein P1S60_09700 [Anaerolineae bacterium]|nr:hypothetical protein [Anaerolineae bacterium]